MVVWRQLLNPCFGNLWRVMILSSGPQDGCWSSSQDVCVPRGEKEEGQGAKSYSFRLNQPLRERLPEVSA